MNNFYLTFWNIYYTILMWILHSFEAIDALKMIKMMKKILIKSFYNQHKINTKLYYSINDWKLKFSSILLPNSFCKQHILLHSLLLTYAHISKMPFITDWRLAQKCGVPMNKNCGANRLLSQGLYPYEKAMNPHNYSTHALSLSASGSFGCSRDFFLPALNSSAATLQQMC